MLWSREDTLLLISQQREQKKLFRGERSKQKRVEANNNEYPNSFQTFAHDLNMLNESGKLAFRKFFDHNIFQKCSRGMAFPGVNRRSLF